MNNDWIRFTGTYEKEWYDVQLHDGTIVETVYPNAGYFYSGIVTKKVDFKDVALYKPGKHPLDII